MFAILDTCLRNVAIANRVLLIIAVNCVLMRVHFQLNIHVIVFIQTFNRRLLFSVILCLIINFVVDVPEIRRLKTSTHNVIGHPSYPVHV